MYLPFIKTKGHPTVGLKSLALQDWIEIDDDFVAQLNHKTGLLAHHHADVFVALEQTEAAQKEVLQRLTAHLFKHFPSIYQPLDQGICNLQTGQVWQFSDFANAPLDLAGRLVQEDLCLLLPGEAGYVLSAASVCFPLRWCLRGKLGLPMGQIHQRVPTYSQKLARPVDNIFARLRDDFPGLRFNWSIVDSPELHLSQDKLVTEFDPAITADNAGQSLWLRVERQTIRRLPESGGVLFTIHTYIYPLEQVTAVPAVAAQLEQAVQSLMPDMQVYKNLLPFRAALLSYLAVCAEEKAFSAGARSRP